jgi:hypothetical protein
LPRKRLGGNEIQGQRIRVEDSMRARVRLSACGAMSNVLAMLIVLGAIASLGFAGPRDTPLELESLRRVIRQRPVDPEFANKVAVIRGPRYASLVPDLVVFLDDPQAGGINWEERAAAQALARIGPDALSGFESLRKGYGINTDSVVRALEELAQSVGAAEAASHALAWLSSDNGWEASMPVVYVLYAIKPDPRFVVPELVKILERRAAALDGSKDADAKFAAQVISVCAVDALANLGRGAKASLPALEAQLRSPDMELRLVAARAIARIAGQPSRERATALDSVAQTVSEMPIEFAEAGGVRLVGEVLVEFEQDGLKAIVERLKSEKLETRNRAAIILQSMERDLASVAGELELERIWKTSDDFTQLHVALAMSWSASTQPQAIEMLKVLIERLPAAYEWPEEIWSDPTKYRRLPSLGPILGYVPRFGPHAHKLSGVLVSKWRKLRLLPACEDFNRYVLEAVAATSPDPAQVIPLLAEDFVKAERPRQWEILTCVVKIGDPTGMMEEHVKAYFDAALMSKEDALWPDMAIYRCLDYCGTSRRFDPLARELMQRLLDSENRKHREAFIDSILGSESPSPAYAPRIAEGFAKAMDPRVVPEEALLLGKAVARLAPGDPALTRWLETEWKKELEEASLDRRRIGDLISIAARCGGHARPVLPYLRRVFADEKLSLGVRLEAAVAAYEISSDERDAVSFVERTATAALAAVDQAPVETSAHFIGESCVVDNYWDAMEHYAPLSAAKRIASASPGLAAIEQRLLNHRVREYRMPIRRRPSADAKGRTPWGAPGVR